MKNLFKIGITFIILLIGCKSKIVNTDNNLFVPDTANVQVADSVIYNEVKDITELIDKPVNIDSLLQVNIEVASNIKYEDSLYYALGNKAFYGDNITGQIVVFTKLEKEGDIYAFVNPNTFDDETQPNLIIYKLNDKKWDIVEKYNFDYSISYFEEVVLDKNENKVIQTIGYPNMNGNYWNNFYSYSQIENRIINGGGFFSSMYEINNDKERVEVEYGGSWYMPVIKSIYYWKNHKLIPYKEVEVGLKRTDMRHEAQYIKYSENLNLDKDSLEIKFKKNYRGKKLNYLFDNFFENN